MRKLVRIHDSRFRMQDKVKSGCGSSDLPKSASKGVHLQALGRVKFDCQKACMYNEFKLTLLLRYLLSQEVVDGAY